MTGWIQVIQRNARRVQLSQYSKTFVMAIYTVSHKNKSLYNLAHNFAKCWLIFKILSLTDSLVNLQQNLH